ncbi:subtilisin-like protein [Hesseltinella vesiculosa]|uniref:Subtilisin-like protein n=1 Tax=Hesseltinella vesiculosa TaxID=101127 RepID=A0A1X2G2W2_9FUNG|nr:subtilisin-like protein [Hesseltinella vesiculosa]
MIETGEQFTAVAGTFSDEAFVDYLHQQTEVVDYVEPNQLYHSALFIPTALELEDEEEHGTEASWMPMPVQMKVADAPNWGLSRITHRSNSDLRSYGFQENAGEGIHAYVLDSGIHVSHNDFEGRAIKEASFVNSEDEEDYGGHGTHVAGKIAGLKYGVAKKAMVHAVKILDKSGTGTTSGLIKAISHVIQVAEPGRALINLSLSGPRSKVLNEIIHEATRNHNIPVFVSAGNAGTDACYFSPSSSIDVFAVGATDMNDRVPSYSDVGKCVSLYAPGSAIESTWIGSDDATQFLDGTSMANPHVAGIAATLMSERSYATVDELYDDIRSLATPDMLNFELTKKSSPNNNLIAYFGSEA